MTRKSERRLRRKVNGAQRGAGPVRDLGSIVVKGTWRTASGEEVTYQAPVAALVQAGALVYAAARGGALSPEWWADAEGWLGAVAPGWRGEGGRHG